MPNFYGTVSGFQEYNLARGRSISELWYDAYIQAALVVASEWLDNAYDKIWFGYAVGGYTQERKWPRASAMTTSTPVYVFREDETPEAVLQATYEAAFREATKPGCLLLAFTPQKYKSASISGAIDVEYVVPNDASEIQTQMPIIGLLMEPLIDPRRGSTGGYSGTLGRA